MLVWGMMTPTTYGLKKNISNSCWIVGFMSVLKLRHPLFFLPPLMQWKQLPECSQLEKNCADSCPSSAGVGIQPCQGASARQGLHHQSPMLMNWIHWNPTTKQSQLAQVHWFVLLQCCSMWCLVWYWGSVVTHPLHQNCCHHHHLMC